MTNKCIGWKEKHCPDHIINKIDTIRETSDDGKVKFQGFEYHWLKTLLYGMLDFPENIPEIDARKLLEKALIKSGQKGKITTKSFFSEICKLERNYQSSPVADYVLITLMSIDQSSDIGQIRIINPNIHLEKSLSENFRLSSDTRINMAKNSLFADMPENYIWVKVDVSAKSIHHAVDQALEEIDLMRGIWNFAINKNSFRVTLGGKPEPVNKIIIGPIHTLHKPNGELVDNNKYWYEPYYLGQIQDFSLTEAHFEVMNQISTKFEEISKTHKYLPIIKKALLRYTRALDDRNWTVSFIKLWSILELLTNTENDRYDETIRRTTFLYSEYEYHKQLINLLRDYRNSYVHFDETNNEIEIYLYQIKDYVEKMMDFHMFNNFDFSTIKKASEFLTLPYQDVDILDKINLLNFARTIRGNSK